MSSWGEYEEKRRLHDARRDFVIKIIGAFLALIIETGVPVLIVVAILKAIGIL